MKIQYNRKIYKYPHIYVGMATKNISITEEAYKRLANLRKTNESFSEIILEVVGKKRLSDFFGILSKEGGKELEDNIQMLREKHRKERSGRIMRISEELRS